MREPAVDASAVPGEALVHPVSLAAIALLVVNDHVLKAMAPGVVTGKLSDFAGLAFFPLLLIGVWELIAASHGSGPAGSRAITVAVGFTAAGFALVKTTAIGAGAVGWAIGALQWAPAAAAQALLWRSATLRP
ncbi:MAG TPA: hypothetical protein VF484_00640, partial [Candidatus Limnocylindrales bacterium]